MSDGLIRTDSEGFRAAVTVFSGIFLVLVILLGLGLYCCSLWPDSIP